MNEQRRTLIVDRRFQFHLILEALLITFIAINAVVIAMFLLLYGTVIPADAGLVLGTSIATIEIVALIVILWLARRLSNRIAGPVYRICRTLETVAEGDSTARVQLRANDHFMEQAENINSALARIQRRIESLQALARQLREEPRTDLARQLEQELAFFRTTLNPAETPETENQGTVSASDDRGARNTPGSGKGEPGYTLIELLMVLLVISILTLIGLPLYLDYTIRSQVSEGFVIVDPVKRGLTEYNQETGSFPTDHLHAESTAGLGPPEYYRSPYVNTIRVLPEGVIEIMYSISALGARNLLFLTPHTGVAGAFSWTCDDQRPNSLRPKYRPQVCRNP